MTDYKTIVNVLIFSKAGAILILLENNLDFGRLNYLAKVQKKMPRLPSLLR